MKYTIMILALLLNTAIANADSDDKRRDKDREGNYKNYTSQEMFDQLDTNKDKQLSIKEYIGFAKLDIDKNDSISLDEFSKLNQINGHYMSEDHFSFRKFFGRLNR
jgi:DUF4097 and DUF4098 domain-containing protein YvlB